MGTEARTPSRLGGPVQRARALHRDLGLAVPGLATRILPGSPAAETLAAALRRALPDRRAEQLLLPLAGGVELRALASGDAERLRDGRQGQPLPHACEAAARSPGPRGPVPGAGYAPRLQARPGPAPA